MPDAHTSSIRYMTVAEYHLWDQGKCPNCKEMKFLMGSRGGLMRNIECCNCGMKLNVMDPNEFKTTLPRISQVIHEPPGYKQPTGPSMGNWMKGLFGLRRAAKQEKLKQLGAGNA